MTQPVAPTYETIEADPVKDAATILRIWSGNFGPDEEHPEKFRHIYIDGAFGPSVVVLLRHVESGEDVGVIAAVPRPMTLDGKAIRAAVVSHFAVVPQHRSLGPALRLPAGIIEACKDRFDLIYGIPNDKAAPILKRAGYDRIGSLARHVKVLRYGGYAGRVLPRALASHAAPLIDAAVSAARGVRRLLPDGLAAAWTAAPSADFDALWTAAPLRTGLGAIRKADLLAWRLSLPLGVRIRYLEVRSGGSLLAWFACEDTTGTTGRVTIADYWFGDISADMRGRCIRRLLSTVAADGYAAIELLISGDRLVEDGWKAARFVERDAAPIMAKWYCPEMRKTPPGRIHMTYLDQDS